jgi:hypothetical protein
MFVEKWLQVVSSSMGGGKEMRMPKEIINIIKEYAIIPARQQFTEKYFGVQQYEGMCAGYHRDTCKKKYEKMDVNTMNKIKNNSCQKCKGYVSWRAMNNELRICNSCNAKGDSRIVQQRYDDEEDESEKIDESKDHAYDNQPSLGSRKSMVFNACKNCSIIDFCPLAESSCPEEICLFNIACILCRQKVCKHSIYEEIVGKDKMDKCLCKPCGQYSLMGRNMMETFASMSTNPPATFQDFLQRIMSRGADAPLKPP